MFVAVAAKQLPLLPRLIHQSSFSICC